MRGLAGVLAVRGELDTAAPPARRADSAPGGDRREPAEYSVEAYAAVSAPVLDRLDEPDVAAAFAAGKAMSVEDATALALTSVGREAPL